ncbi:MAG TPA: hypothetical protein VGC30_11465 [Dokdonella sp.]
MRAWNRSGSEYCSWPPALHVDHQLARDRERDARAEILLDQREREIDAGGDAAGAVVRAVLDEDRAAVDDEARNVLRERRGETPVGCDATAVEQSGRRDAVDAGADAGEPAQARRAFGDPRRGLAVRRLDAQSGAAGNDQRVELRRVRDGHVRDEAHARLAGERTFRQSDHAELVDRPPRRRIDVGDVRERLQRADEVDAVDAVVAEHADAQRKVLLHRSESDGSA